MKSEGINPDLLSNPDAPAPPDDRATESTDSDSD